MSNRFDTALVNRERTRQLLSEQLDAKFESEYRRRRFVQLFVLLVLGAAGYYVARGAVFVASNTKPIEFGKKNVPDPGILAQMKQQMSEGDPMMIGQSAPERVEPVRSHGDRASFAPEKVPLNLYGDLNRKHSSFRPGYDLPTATAKRALEELGARRSRSAAPDYGKYRPAVTGDLPKIPPPRRVPPLPHSDLLYAQRPALPLALTADEHEFPFKK